MTRAAALAVTGLMIFSGFPGVTVAQKQEMVQVSSEDPEGDRKRIVEKSMELTEEEAAAFWPVYAEYRKAMDEVDDKRVAAMRKLAESYQDLTDAKALELLDDYFRFRQAKVNLQTDYIARFNEVLPGRKVMRYYQVENLIETRVDFDLTRAIPLAR